MPHVSLGRVSTPCGISVDSSMFMVDEEKSAKNRQHISPNLMWYKYNVIINRENKNKLSSSEILVFSAYWFFNKQDKRRIGQSKPTEKLVSITA